MFNCDLCLFKTVKEGNFLSHMAGHREQKKKSIENSNLNREGETDGVKSENMEDGNKI